MGQSPLDLARLCFLEMIAEAKRFEVDYDGDITSDGGQVDLTTYHLTVGWRQLEELCDVLGLKRLRLDEPLKARIDRHVKETS